MIDLVFKQEDDGILHIEKHSVTSDEIFELFFDTNPIRKNKLQRNRFAIYGKLKSSGRYLKCYCKELKKNVIEISTAFDIEDEMIIQALDKMYDY